MYRVFLNYSNQFFIHFSPSTYFGFVASIIILIIDLSLLSAPSRSNQLSSHVLRWSININSHAITFHFTLAALSTIRSASFSNNDATWNTNLVIHSMEEYPIPPTSSLQMADPGTLICSQADIKAVLNRFDSLPARPIASQGKGNYCCTPSISHHALLPHNWSSSAISIAIHDEFPLRPPERDGITVDRSSTN